MLTFKSFLQEVSLISTSRRKDIGGIFSGRHISNIRKRGTTYEVYGKKDEYHVVNTRSQAHELSVFGTHHTPKTFEVKSLQSNPGNTLKAHELYHHLVTHHGITLSSDKEQSPGGMKTWHKLAKKKDVNTYAWDIKTKKPLNVDIRKDQELTHSTYDRSYPSMEKTHDDESKYVAKNIRLVATAKK